MSDTNNRKNVLINLLIQKAAGRRGTEDNKTKKNLKNKTQDERSDEFLGTPCIRDMQLKYIKMKIIKQLLK